MANSEEIAEAFQKSCDGPEPCDLDWELLCAESCSSFVADESLKRTVKACVALLPPGLLADFHAFGELMSLPQKKVSVTTLFSGTDGVIDAMKARLWVSRSHA